MKRWFGGISVIALGGCAMPGARHEHTAVAPPTPAACAGTSEMGQYLVEAPSFSLSASTDATRREATRSLAASATAFGVLFGECPPHIGVVVVDTSAVAESATIPVPNADATTVMLLSAGLDGPGKREAAAALAGAVRFTSANAWLSDYSRWWRAEMDENQIVLSNRNGEAVPRAAYLPDWLRVGMLGMLTEDDASRARRTRSTVDTLSLRTLFSYKLPLRDAVLVERALHELASPEPGAKGSDEPPSARDALPREFVRQSTSVVRYLRAIEGDEAMSYLLAASIGGLGTDDILAHLPHRTSADALERDWRQWASGAQRVSAVTPARKR